MNCPACNSRATGKVGVDQFYCWDCCVEFNQGPLGTRIYRLDEEGSLEELNASSLGDVAAG